MTVSFDHFLQMFPDDGFSTRRGAHRAFSTPESIAREGAAAREFYDWWTGSGQPALRGASAPPTLDHAPAALVVVPHDDDASAAADPRERELVGAGAPVPATARPTGAQPLATGSTGAWGLPSATATPSAMAAPTRAGSSAATAASAPSAEPKLTGWSRFKHELTRKR